MVTIENDRYSHSYKGFFSFHLNKKLCNYRRNSLFTTFTTFCYSKIVLFTMNERKCNEELCSVVFFSVCQKSKEPMETAIFLVSHIASASHNTIYVNKCSVAFSTICLFFKFSLLLHFVPSGKRITAEKKNELNECIS